MKSKQICIVWEVWPLGPTGTPPDVSETEAMFFPFLQRPSHIGLEIISLIVAHTHTHHVLLMWWHPILSLTGHKIYTIAFPLDAMLGLLTRATCRCWQGGVSHTQSTIHEASTDAIVGSLSVLTLENLISVKNESSWLRPLKASCWTNGNIWRQIAWNSTGGSWTCAQPNHNFAIKRNIFSSKNFLLSLYFTIENPKMGLTPIKIACHITCRTS